MEEIEKLVEELSIETFEMESIHWVEVTHVTDPFNFFVRPVKYKNIVKAFEALEPTAKLVSVNIKDLVIFNLGFSCGGRKYMRGRVVNIVRDMSDHKYIECEILAIDYGFTEKGVPIEYIWECVASLANTPPLAYNCQLANCYPLGIQGFTPEIVQAFHYYSGFEPVKMKVLGKKPNKLLVELVNSNPESIATLLAISGYSILGHFYDVIPWKPVVGHNKMFFSFKTLTIDKKLHVRVLSGNSLKEFHVAKIKDYEKHIEEIDVITFYARREFPLAPTHLIEGTLVCVKNDEKNIYERAFVKKVTKPNESAIVQLVDWGTDEEFPIAKMKYMSSQCLRTPVLAIYCKAEESQAWDNGFEQFLTPGFEFNIKIKRIGHQFECPNTVDISPVKETGQDEARALEPETNE